jgi:hypothetical protein
MLENLTGKEPTKVVTRAEFERMARDAVKIDEEGNIIQKTIFIVKPIMVPTTQRRKTRTEKQCEIYH